MLGMISTREITLRIGFSSFVSAFVMLGWYTVGVMTIPAGIAYKFGKEGGALVTANGCGVVAALAEIYPQLYLQLGDAEQYAAVVRRGEIPAVKDLSGFRTDELDAAEVGVTPAGSVQIVKLTHRSDFERFYQIMGYKCQPEPIPPQTGAVILDGVINWTRIRAHQAEFLAADPAGNWSEEFRQFTSVKSNYLDALVILSSGDYSGVPAERFGYAQDEWRRLSYEIRKAHELTHFLCRRKYHEQINAIWDELVADAVGIVSALGRFDRGMEEVFLGVTPDGYTGGRLETYTDSPGELSTRICEVLGKFETLYQPGTEPFAFAELLEEQQAVLWGA